ncbi:MAG: fumarylacetoacetate hydrolase family protein, partial [Thermoplasmata archaeon]|nr:fumarylacetoacetate hydrolase family protein [Thermoplasmata archaeon]
PPASTEVHHEVELAVVMGKGGRHIPAEKALDDVLGYAVLLDITARDIQDRLKAQRLPWAYAKGWDTFAPISTVAPRDEVGDPGDLRISLSVNGEVRQGSSTRYLLFSVAEIISFISGFMTLRRGDIIATGTPEGVGPIVPGDRVHAEIERVGKLDHDVVLGRAIARGPHAWP